MNNAGNPETNANIKPGGCLSSPLALMLIGVMMIVSAVVLLQAAPMLYTMAFPPTLPVPEGSTLIRHRQYTHGVDEWLYNAPIRACEWATQLRARGIECAGSFGCGGDDQPDPYTGFITQCRGEQTVSLFKVQWIITLNPDQSDPMRSTFQVYREMFWGGAIPQLSFSDIQAEIDARMMQTGTPAP